jgi:starch-binding outer membrane protein, SusD/RagB family
MYFQLDKIRNAAVVLAVIASCAGCKKWVQVPPPTTSTAQADVYSEDATAISTLTGIYTQMSNTPLNNGGLCSMSLFPGLSADEFSVFGNSNQPVTNCYTNSMVASGVGPADLWSAIYPLIYVANSAIAGLTASTTLTPAIKQQLLGEAKFVRAFGYFYLVNLYGDAPLVTQPSYQANSTLSRTPASEVYQQIIADCVDAQNELSSNYLDGTLLSTTPDRVRPTSWAATALLARCYLYNQNWDSAIAEATTLINNSALFQLDTLNGVFLKDGPEAIWQLQPVIAGENTQDGWLFIIPGSGPDLYSHPFFLNPYLVNSFDSGDARRVNWIDSVQANGTTYYFPYKYKSAMLTTAVTEYEVILRLGEIYLIRAEAEAQTGDLGDAVNDLNAIRNRAGLGSDSATSSADLLHKILHERQVELFTEWGHRWFDLKRTGTIDSVMTVVNPLKGGGGWKSSSQWYPISSNELQYDPNLKQNTGY